MWVMKITSAADLGTWYDRSVGNDPMTTTTTTSDKRSWTDLLRGGYVRNAFGVLVLAAILGGLLALDRIGGGELGPLDDRSPSVGELAPQFELRNVDGQVVRLSDFRGKVVWINFWATWCGPCRRELPDIARLAAEFSDDDLVVLAVNQEQSAAVARDFWEELGLDLPILLDSSREVSAQYRLRGLPDNFFIDREGVLQSFQLGFLVEEQMREGLAAAGLSQNDHVAVER